MAQDALNEKLRHLPHKPGAYIMKDDRGEVIYVGKASSLRSRVRSYFQRSNAIPPKVSVMVAKVQDVDWIVTETELEALMLECNLIKQHRPRYNVRLRDDKHYPYLCLTTSEPFPRVIVVRRARQDGNRYFGPYADSQAMRESMRIIRRAFRVRGCNKHLSGGESDQPCLNYHIGQCDSPCSGAVSAAGYGEIVRNACLFLEGKQEYVAGRLEREMLLASDDLQFERAAKLRDQLEAVRKVAARQKAIGTSLTDQDVIAASVDADSACVQILFIRAGKLVEQQQFLLEGTAVNEAEEWLSGFIKQYYAEAAYVPGLVLVSHEPPDVEILQEWLSTRRGLSVKLLIPKRGEKRKLVNMASENAALALRASRDIQRTDRERVAAELSDLASALGLSSEPKRIEAYDISNTQGREAVGSMVVFKDGLPAKSHYKRFKIRVSEKPDDCNMIREVLIRRLQRAVACDAKFGPLPELIIIDGGRGQLSAALDALRRVLAESEDPVRHSCEAGKGSVGGPGSVSEAIANITIVGLAKRVEEAYLPGQTSPMLLPLNSPALRLLRALRDEAHRFAVEYHRKLRAKSSRKSVLDGIPGIGPSRRKALLKRFGSVAGLRAAVIEEIEAVPGISKAVAQSVYEALHGA